MFELADRLVGIYKTDNCTKSITIDPCSFVVCQKGAWDLWVYLEMLNCRMLK